MRLPPGYTLPMWLLAVETLWRSCRCGALYLSVYPDAMCPACYRRDLEEARVVAFHRMAMEWRDEPTVVGPVY